MSASAADVLRSTPGYVYGIAMACSGDMEPFTPDCSCPCHFADAPYPSYWYCDKCWTGISRWTAADNPCVQYTHEQAIVDGKNAPRQPMHAVADYYFVTKGNTLSDELEEHFPTREEAQARADELNSADVLASLNLDPGYAARRTLLKTLGPTFWVQYGEGHPEERWPEEPGRYAVEEWSDRYSESFWTTYDSLAEVREEIASGDVERVVDLDTGRDVSFRVDVQIEELS